MTLLCDSDAHARPSAAPLPTFDTDDWSRRLIAPEPETLPALRVLFAGGGTGGHLYPAIAVARALGQLAPGSEALFVGSERPLERKILAGAEQAHRALPTAPWRGLGGAPRFAWQQARGLAASWPSNAASSKATLDTTMHVRMSSEVAFADGSFLLQFCIYDVI